MIWSGSAFGNKVLLDSSANTSTAECFDVAYEMTSGNSIVCWSRSATTIPQYRRWSAGAWGSVTAMTDVGGNTRISTIAAR